MAYLYRVFGTPDGALQLETDHTDPIRKARNLYIYAQAPEGAEQHEVIDSLFIELDDGLWDHQCALADLPQVKAYLADALQYLEQITNEEGSLIEPYKSRFKMIDQYDLWESGFFYWENDDRVQSREFIPVVAGFMEFLDRVMANGSDLLRRTDD